MIELCETLDSVLVRHKKALLDLPSIDNVRACYISGNTESYVAILLSYIDESYFLKWSFVSRGIVLCRHVDVTLNESYELIEDDLTEIVSIMSSQWINDRNMTITGRLKYTPLDDIEPLEEGKCYMCNIRYCASEEHVFPRWIQRRYDLWHKKISLMNGSNIKYKSLTVPSCKICNSQLMGDIERRMAISHDEGYWSFKNFSKVTLFQWLGKILLGILTKETMLLMNQRDRGSEKSIVPNDMWGTMDHMRKWLSSIYRPVKFDPPLPWSVYVVRLDADHGSFNYMDTVSPPCIALQMGEIGVILSAFEPLIPSSQPVPGHRPYANISDDSYGRLVDKIGHRALSEPQFIELFCLFSYQLGRIIGHPVYSTFAKPGASAGGAISVRTEPVPFDLKEHNPEDLYKNSSTLIRHRGYHMDRDGSVLFDDMGNLLL